MIELTLEELIERLKRLDEVTLLELLNIDSEDIVVAFRDLIDDNYEKLLKEVEYDNE